MIKRRRRTRRHQSRRRCSQCGRGGGPPAAVGFGLFICFAVGFSVVMAGLLVMLAEMGVL